MVNMAHHLDQTLREWRTPENLDGNARGGRLEVRNDSGSDEGQGQRDGTIAKGTQSSRRGPKST